MTLHSEDLRRCSVASRRAPSGARSRLPPPDLIRGRYKRIIVTPYDVGDVLAFDPTDPIPLEKQRRWAKMRPQGEAFTARLRGDAGAPVACMGLFQEADGGFRVWALAAARLAPTVWGDLFRAARAILDAAPARVIRATAGDPRQAKCLERCGFLAARTGARFPVPGARIPQPYVRLK